MAVHLLIVSGYLGAGKSTLLQRYLPDLRKKDIRAALLVNEIGELNIDGMLLDSELPAESLVSGCVCCTLRGDFSLAVIELVQNYRPDWIIVECTGAANPVELLQAVADIALTVPVGIVRTLSVIDGAAWHAQFPWKRTPLHRLLNDQLRCANDIVISHLDRIPDENAKRFEREIRKKYPMAEVWLADRGQIRQRNAPETAAADFLDHLLSPHAFAFSGHSEANTLEETAICGCGHDHDHGVFHAMVHMFPVRKAVTSSMLEQLAQLLPRHVHRGKGILTLKEDGRRVLYQYAFQTWETVPIVVNEGTSDTIVWIGEHMDCEALNGTLEHCLHRDPDQ